MPEFGNQINDNLSEQGAEKATNVAKNVGKRAGKAAAKQVKKLVRKYGKKAIRALGKAAVKVGKAIAQLIAKIVAALGPIGLIVLAVIIIICLIFVFLLDERGSNESNDLDPDVQNPSYVESTSGITKAIALTEPQAVIDAYYKYLSCSSYTKAYGGSTYMFNDPDQTEDFSGLRDYNKIEDNFYLSDDFIRSLDEMLHNEDFYYPEQVIKPVFGQLLTLKDKNGKEGEYYTSRFPTDTPKGEDMLDEELVKSFSDMLADESDLELEGVSGDSRQLIAESQVPTVSADNEDEFELQERNVVYGDSIQTEKGLWDYGFGSVIQYQPDQKISYIECSYDSVDVDYHVSYWEVVGHDALGNPIYGWGSPVHGTVQSASITGTLADLKEYCQDVCDSWYVPEGEKWSYNLPTNIEAIVDDNVAWDISDEPNADAEKNYYSLYHRDLVNSHIDMKIEDAWDADIDKIQFNDSKLKEDYGNVGGGLYPINIAIANHAATFSGNIHYTITPAGTEGCIVEESELKINTEPVTDHREPVQTIQVDGGCGVQALTAHRTGKAIVQKPKVEETTSPWGFSYMERYAEYYTTFVPNDFMDDRDFFVRTGLTAEEGSEEKEEYKQNLEFLMDLGLLRLYTGNVQLGAIGSVDLSTLDDENSDLYILSHVIAAEAGPSKLDELMVGAVFVNRVASSSYPNTFQEVLQQPNQYACYTDGNYQSAQPTDREIASAIQVLTGQFSIPENVVFQSGDINGTIYKLVDNPGNLVDHYYCAGNGVTISTVDRFGRPAPDASQLESLAESLDGESPEQASTSSSIDYSSTAFIGDTMTMGLNDSKGLREKGALVIADYGLTIADATRACESNGDLDSSIRTVYLLIGLNSCGLTDDAFKTDYLELLETIQEKTNGAQIILTSLPPVIDGKSNVTNAHIDAKNTVISNLASENGYKVLDIHSSLLDGDQLNSNYSDDGQLLNDAGYDVWFSKLQSGLTSSSVSSNPSDAYQLLDEDGIPIRSDYTLYDISEFDVLTATNMQARLEQADSGLIAAIGNILGYIGESISDFISDFFKGIGEVFSTAESTIYLEYQQPYNNYDVKSTVYHSIAFANQVWFSTAESTADAMADTENGLMFLFVGKNNLLGLGTLNSMSIQMVPGVGTTVEGMISPTDTYYRPLTSYSPSLGYMEISTPSSTNILAVADGAITAVNDDVADARGKYVIMETTIGGDTYEITYGYLDTIHVVAGKEVRQGDLIGTSGTRQDGTPAMYLSVRKNGELVDPMSIFYQMTYVSGPSLGGVLNRADGTVDEAAIAALEEELTNYVNSHGGKYHNDPLNPLTYKQCTWWAFGRALEYLEFINSPVTYNQFKAFRFNNGGTYANQNIESRLFNYGSTPKPNSIVCYPGSPGHVAYVEAVDYVNECYYQSEAGGGDWWGGITKRNFGYRASGSGGTYQAGIFIYLDEPLV